MILNVFLMKPFHFSGILGSFEKTLADVLFEKEQQKQTYEQQLVEAKADRDTNYRHLTSLETTFSDLHV